MTACIDIVIVNWNSGDQLRECLESITFAGSHYRVRAIVVDNGSTDDSLARSHTSALTETVVLEEGRNLGFAKACNIGARRGDGDYILFLNPDARLAPDTLALCASFLESDEGAQVGVLGPKLIDESGKVQRGCARFPSWRTYVSKGLGLAQLAPRLFPSVHLEEFDHLETREVDHVIGAAYFIRRHIFEELGGFDERFFVYLEDLDLSLRVSRAGWRVIYFAEAHAYHKGGGVSEQVKAERLFYSLQSRIAYATKHYSRTGALLVLLSTCGPELATRMVRAALRRSSEEARDTFSAYRMLIVALPRIFRRSRPASSPGN